MAENIAEKMLRILPNDRSWIKRTLVNGKRRCMIGARMHDEMLSRRVSDLNEDEYTQLLARITREQFPERVVDVGSTTISKVMGFNDHPDTRFADVRMVLEKAAVEWEEKHDD